MALAFQGYMIKNNTPRRILREQLVLVLYVETPMQGFTKSLAATLTRKMGVTKTQGFSSFG